MRDKLQQLRDLIAELGYDSVRIFDNSLGFDYADAFIGMSNDGRAVYSYDKMIEHIMVNEGWSYEEAVEWIDYNTIRALYRPDDPIVVYDVPEYMWDDGPEEVDATQEIKDSSAVAIKQEVEEILKVPEDRLKDGDD